MAPAGYCRIQKYLSEQGICSRRKAEEWILKGWVSVNGTVVRELGTQINPDVDQVTVDLQATSQKTITIAYHKPRGIVTNCPLPGEREIRDLLPKSLKHLSSIGRLDKDSEGIILLTDDGVLARHYLDAKYPHEREYHVWLDHEMTLDQIRTLERGILLFGQRTLPLKIKVMAPRQISMIMREGKNRQIRRMMRHVGLTVTRLMRVRFGSFKVDGLRPGEFEEVTDTFC